MAREIVSIINNRSKNYIINGGFDLSQRGTSFVSVGNGDYTVDRFVYSKVGSGVHSVSRNSDVPSNGQSNYSLLVDCTTADATIDAADIYSINYRMEGNDFISIAGKTFTLSFWVKAPKVGTYCVAFRNDAVDKSYIVEYTIDTIDTWEYKTITITHDKTGTWLYENNIGLRIDWVLGCGSNRQNSANSWQSGNFVATSNQVNAVDSVTNNFRLSQIMLNEGSTAAPFQKAGENIESEFTLCQRYYQQMSTGNFYSIGAIGHAIDTNTLRLHIPLPVELRALPTVVLSEGGVDLIRVGGHALLNGINTATVSALAKYSNGVVIQVDTDAAVLTTNNLYSMHINSSTVSFDAEL